VPLALVAGASVPTWWEKGGRAGRIEMAALLVLFLFPGTTWGMARHLLARAPAPEADLREAATWVRQETPPGSVLVGASTELATPAARALLYARPSASPSLGYPDADLAWRREAVRELRGGRPVGEPERDRLLALERPVYLVQRSAVDGISGEEYREVHRNDTYAIVLWSPSERRQ
jgi:hypothetical protein